MAYIGASLPENEDARLEYLQSLRLTKTYESPLDKITTLCTNIFETDISLVSIVDHNIQWFKSNQGLELTSTSRNSSYCAFLLVQKEPHVLVVNTN